jgi:hypothetical protein
VRGPGIACGLRGAICVASFPAGATIRLEVEVEPGWSLSAWSSSCQGGLVSLAGSRTCGVTIVSGGTATPAATPAATASGLVRLTVAVTGQGTVLASGIVCGAGGALCRVDVPTGTRLSLETISRPGFRFAGWSGTGCAGTMLLSSSRSCTASFVPIEGENPPPFQRP